MANTRRLKKRVKSVRNIGKITKALEMASAAKVAAAQEKALSAKPCAILATVLTVAGAINTRSAHCA